MSCTCKVIPTERFNKDVEYYIKKKKFSKIGDDIDEIIDCLENGNFVGDLISEIKSVHKTYKVRAANSNTNVGKLNGYRLIYYAITEDLEVYLLTVYYKKDDNRIPTNNEIKQIIEEYCE